MSNWSNQTPQTWNNNYQNQYGGHNQSNQYAENQYGQNYNSHGSRAKNPLQQQYIGNKQYQGQNSYQGNGYGNQSPNKYEEDSRGNGRREPRSRNQKYQTSDDVRPLTERQQFQQYPQNNYQNGNRKAYDQGSGGYNRNNIDQGRKYQDNYGGGNQVAYGSPTARRSNDMNYNSSKYFYFI